MHSSLSFYAFYCIDNQFRLQIQNRRIYTNIQKSKEEENDAFNKFSARWAFDCRFDW